MLAGSGVAKSVPPQQDFQQMVEVGDDATKATANTDIVARPSLIDGARTKLVSVKKISPLKDFEPSVEELPANGYFCVLNSGRMVGRVSVCIPVWNCRPL